MDSSKRSLKCVLLHNGNLYGSVPLGHSTTLKEKYDEIKFILEKISYRQHQWIICVDLKMVGVSPRATRWLHKISLLLMFVGQQGKNRALDTKRLACAQYANSWLFQCSGSSFGGTFQNCVSSSSHKAWHHETVCEGS